MSRAPFQVLVLPYRFVNDRREYCVFRRQDSGRWQGVAGGGEDDETPEPAARRELMEETGLELPVQRLQSMDTMPVTTFRNRRHYGWPDDLYVVPQYTFGVDATGREVVLSDEHSGLAWLDYQVAHDLLFFQSNKNALWELDYRLASSALS
jgi:dATP pyrophosphohydrolase